MHRGWIAMAALAGTLGAAALPAEETYLQPRDDQVARTNAFMQEALALHKRVIAAHDIRTVEDSGGYKGYPEFYRELRYYERESGRLLSKVQWEQAHPERLHAIEVYVYDDQGQVARDYAGWYMPEGRNAPRDTWITLHAYNGGLHAVRQFDALDNRVYESCEGRYQGEAVALTLWELDIAAASGRKDGVMHTPLYRKCFAGLPVSSAGRYLTPQ